MEAIYAAPMPPEDGEIKPLPETLPDADKPLPEETQTTYPAQYAVNPSDTADEPAAASVTSDEEKPAAPARESRRRTEFLMVYAGPEYFRNKSIEVDPTRPRMETASPEEFGGTPSPSAVPEPSPDPAPASAPADGKPRFCPECGRKLLKPGKFCPECGAFLPADGGKQV